MVKKIFCLFSLLILFHLNTTAQNQSNDQKIDSLTNKIDHCINCSRDLYRRAKIYLLEDEKMKAMSDLNEAINLHIKYFLKDGLDDIALTEFYNERANLKSDLKDYRGAIQDYDKAISLGKGYASLWTEIFFGKGYCKAKIKDYEGAIESYEKVFIHNRDDKITHFNLGLVMIRLERRNEGCLHLSKAGELGYSAAYEVIADYCN